MRAQGVAGHHDHKGLNSVTGQLSYRVPAPDTALLEQCHCLGYPRGEFLVGDVATLVQESNLLSEELGECGCAVQEGSVHARRSVQMVVPMVSAVPWVVDGINYRFTGRNSHYLSNGGFRQWSGEMRHCESLDGCGMLEERCASASHRVGNQGDISMPKMKSGRRSCLLGLGSAALIAGMPFGRAQAAGESFPERPVKFVVPYPAGGGADMAARTVSVPLASLWKQSVVIDNRTGAGGMIGNEFVSKAPADGCTLLL